MNIGEKIKALRHEKNLTAQQTAEQLGVTRSAYSNYEQGTRKPEYEILVSIAKFFNVTSDYLLGLEDEFGNKYTNDTVPAGTPDIARKSTRAPQPEQPSVPPDIERKIRALIREELSKQTDD